MADNMKDLFDKKDWLDNELQECVRGIRDSIESFKEIEAAALAKRLEAEQFLAELVSEQAVH